ncbi:MAG: IPT/TIG domain-containing protein [Ferruginibacter sp.]
MQHLPIPSNTISWPTGKAWGLVRNKQRISSFLYTMVFINQYHIFLLFYVANKPLTTMKRYSLLLAVIFFVPALFAQTNKQVPLGTPVYGIGSIAPSSGKTNDVITINGYGFTGATAVKFGGINALSFTVNSDAVITAVVGSGATGSVSVTVPGKIQDPMTVAFTYIQSCAATASFTDIMVCSSMLPYAWNGNSYVVAGMYSVVLKNAAGCDSIATLKLAVLAVPTPPNIAAVSRCGPGSVQFNAVSSGSPSSIIRWYADLGLTQLIATGNGFITPVISANTTYYVTAEDLSNGCGPGSPAAAFAAVYDVPTAPTVNSPVELYQFQIPPQLTAVAAEGNTLLWYTQPADGFGTSEAPRPATLFEGNTTYYVSQVAGGVCEGPRAAITVHVNHEAVSVDTIQYCPGANISLTSNRTANTYAWMINRGQSGFDTLVSKSTIENIHTGENTITMTLNGIPASWSGYSFWCATDSGYNKVFLLSYASKWIGGADVNWESAGNWSCGKVPNKNTDVIIDSGTLVIHDDTTIRSLKLSDGASLIVKEGVKLTILH